MGKKNPIQLDQSLLARLKAIMEENDLDSLKNHLNQAGFSSAETGYRNLSEDLDQIQSARTLERARYYLKRLIKCLDKEKYSKFSDINLNRWKDYPDLLTDSLWLIDKRDRSGAHDGSYWGNFVPQIPNQLIRRFTKAGECVLDPFLGSGTTLIECRRLGRNGIGIELNPDVAKKTKERVESEDNQKPVWTEILRGDSAAIDISPELKKKEVSSVQLLLLHPPYWDIIHFSKDRRDLSNALSLKSFLKKLGAVVENSGRMLDTGRYCALIIGDKYCGGEWTPLGFYAMEEVIKHGFQLKSVIVKNYESTRGKQNQQELWRYRALSGGFYVFKHEYIFLFKKT